MLPKALAQGPQTLDRPREYWQYSVFFCVLKEIDRGRMLAQLEEHMNLSEDQCVIMDLGPNEEQARDSATVPGPSLPRTESGVVVV